MTKETGYTGVGGVAGGGSSGPSGPKGPSRLERMWYSLIWYFSFRKRWEDKALLNVMVASCPFCGETKSKLRGGIFGTAGGNFDITRADVQCCGCRNIYSVIIFTGDMETAKNNIKYFTE